jgi:AbrB family looped-hinge helix DNA binding protein
MNRYDITVSRNTQVDTIYFSVKGQVVIPRRLRNEFGIKAGTQARVTATRNGILITPITSAYIKALRGSLKGKGAMKALLEERRRERDF